MKSITLLLLSLLVSASAIRADEKSISFLGDDPYLVKTFTVPFSGHLEVSTVGGHVLVVGSNEPVARVEMHVRKNGRNLTPDDTDLSAYRITIEKSGNTLIAKAERNGRIGNFWNGHSNESISFTVYVPAAFSSSLSTSGGRIGIRNMTAEQTARTSGGSISLENLRGDINVATSGGSISVTTVHGILKATTSGGSIRAKDVAGELELSTSGGSITISEAKGRINARTTGGSINAVLDEVSGDLKLATTGGSINVTLPSSQGFDIDARGHRVESADARFSGTNEHGRLSGSVNGGGIPVKLVTSGGSVRIRYN